MINKKKIIWLLLIALLFLKSGIFCKVLILPFKTEKKLNKSYYWLSKSISFYLTTKLNSININSFTDAEVSKIIRANSINFPYRFTKASAIRIGLINNAKKIIWGKIIISNEKNLDAKITIISYIIDTISFKQQYLPIIKSEVKNISLVQQELFNSVIKRMDINLITEDRTLIKFDNQSYELFIKSLLSGNSTEKKNLLNNSLNLVRQKKGIKSSIDLIKFELAKIYYKEGKHSIVEKYLDKIGSNSIILKNKIFLKALLDSDRENFDSAINKFLDLKKQNSFDGTIDNNLGVLYIKTGDYSKAENYLLDALNKKQSITTNNNLLNLYLKGTDSKKVKNKVIEALNLFPKNADYISLLYYFMQKNKNKDIILSIFNEFLEDKIIIDYYKLELKLQMINPFDISINNSISEGNERNTVLQFRDKKINENITLEDHIQDLDSNPFNFKTALTLSNLYKTRKQFRKAEIYAVYALFLNKSKKTVENLIKLYKLLGKSSKIRELKIILNKLVVK